MDSGSLLVKCDLCGCLVVCSALRALDHLAADLAGTLRRATQLACVDVASCYARTVHPEHWARVGTAIPVREPETGAALLKCQVCDVAATAGELSISRERDEEGWWDVVMCVDRAVRWTGWTPFTSL
jgi:hypothetical protein